MKISKEKYVLTILVTFSTAFSFAVADDNRNLLLIGLMTSVIPFLLLKQFPFLIRKEIPIYILVAYMVLLNLINWETSKFSTLFYTVLFVIAFAYYTRLIRANALALNQYLKILRYLIYAFCITLMLQQFCSLAGLPIINQISSIEEKFKFNSLAPEPSHSARILTLLVYSFICSKDIQRGKISTLSELWRSDKQVLLAFLYSMLTMGSAGAFLFLSILSIKFMKWRNVISVFIVSCISFFGSQFVESESIQRSSAFVKAFLTFDQEELIEADHSGALRVLPGFIYMEKLDLSDLTYWIGKGSGSSIIFFQGLLPGVSDEMNSAGGFFPQFFLDYGLISGFIFLSVLYIYCLRQVLSIDTLLCLAIIPSSALNTQIVWLSLMLLATNKYFAKKNCQYTNFCFK